MGRIPVYFTQCLVSLLVLDLPHAHSFNVLKIVFVLILFRINIFFRENLVLNISSLWEGYPHSEMTFMFKFFFIIQMSYWLHCYPELYFQRTKREEMPARIRYATVGLLYVAAGYLLK